MPQPGQTVIAHVEYRVDDFSVLPAVESAHMTISHGITPSVCMLEVAPEPNFTGQGGTLRFIQNDGTEIEFPDCKVDRQVMREGRDGYVWSLAIQDRRWRWQYCYISGTYNVRLDDGTIDPLTLQTPQQLAQLLLEALGEVVLEVGDLPNDARPAVVWDNTSAARALQSLAEELGCHVVYDLDDTVSLRVLGTGGDLPADGIEVTSLTISPPQRPETLTVACARTRWQVDFPLEAVGVDTDGQVKLIDDLSYKPANGWAYLDNFYSQVATTNNARQYAEQSVYKLYRVTLATRDAPDPPLSLTDYPYGITALWQILPLEDTQVAAAVGADGTLTPLPALVLGVFSAISSGHGNTAPDTPYTQNFRVLRQQGMVQFDEIVYLAVGADPATQTMAPATLYLRTAVSLKDRGTRAPVRYLRERDLGGDIAGAVKIVKHEEIQLSYVTNYADVAPVTTSNRADVNREADYYLTAAERDYELKFPQEITYMGLRKIQLDGAVLQVTLTLGPQGFTTKASRSDEFSNIVPPYRERRMLEQVNAAARREDFDQKQNDWVEGFKRRWLNRLG